MDLPLPRPGLGTNTLALGTLIGAASAYGFLILGQRTLGEDAFAPIALLWTLQFLLFTVLLFPLEQLVIRRLVLGEGAALGRDRWAIAGVVLLGVVIAGGYVAVNADRFDGSQSYVGSAAVLIAGYGFLAVGRGYLAGHRRFRAYGVIIAAEGLIRLAGAVVLALGSGGPMAWAWAMTLGPWAILFVRPFRDIGNQTGSGEEAAGFGLRGFLPGLVLGNVGSQIIISAGALVVDALSASPAQVTIFFTTFTLFRGPLSLTYPVFSRVLPSLTRMAQKGEHRRLFGFAERIGIFGVLLAGVGGTVGYLAGPAVVELFFGGARPTSDLAATAAAGVVAGAAALAVGQILIAQGNTRAYALGWLSALAVAALVVGFGTGQPPRRVATGVAAGEFAALAGMVFATRAGLARLGGESGAG